MNRIVNFKIAKLLKKKNYPQDVFNMSWYNELGSENGRTDLNKEGRTFSEVYPNEDSFCGCAIKPEHKKEFKLESFKAPTIAEVITWLYDAYGIWLWVEFDFLIDEEFSWICAYKCNVGINKDYKVNELYSTPTEAYEAGIIHILKNLL